MSRTAITKKTIIWQLAFIGLSTSWLFAPILNHSLSYRISLISQYESSGQPYAIFFRLADFFGGLLLAGIAGYYLKYAMHRRVSYILLMIGLGMALDPLFITTCHVQARVCVEYFSFGFLLHATETIVTSLLIFALTMYDAIRRKNLVAISFVIFQFAYLTLFFTQYASHHQSKTFSQYIYQLSVILWLAWFSRDYFLDTFKFNLSRKATLFVRYAIGSWGFINGILAIIFSLSHIRLLGKIRGLYFAGDTAWLAQHGVIIGVMMLYLGRHLIRGERRARQIFMIIVGIETLKYSVVTPYLPLLVLYGATFCLLFVTSDYFDRGTINMTWQVRIRDLYYMLLALFISALLALDVLDRDDRIKRTASRAFSNFFEYAFHSDIVHTPHVLSVLLADTATAFLIISAGTILWILFRPYKTSPSSSQNFVRVYELLGRFSNSTEDYFKLWPNDKRYFWAEDGNGFIAYKIVGSVAFALADPICDDNNRKPMLEQFIVWCRSRRLKACFLPIFEERLRLYSGMSKMQIGASALVVCDKYLQQTSNDKWWRWKRNRAVKQGLRYAKYDPPHNAYLLEELRVVSDSWLMGDGHSERTFVLGYFDKDYLQRCTIHALHDQAGKLVAFANQLPSFHSSNTATIDLLRYAPDVTDAMPFLLFNAIQDIQTAGYSYFDLGFVPFASTKGALLKIARTLSANQFSSQGLEQFKNKFDPSWQQNYLAYDGDVGDLAAIALNLEKAMKLRTNS